MTTMTPHDPNACQSLCDAQYDQQNQMWRQFSVLGALNPFMLLPSLRTNKDQPGPLRRPIESISIPIEVLLMSYLIRNY